MSEHNHHHGHHHHHLDAALLLTALFAVVELFGGWLSHSLALLADAVHMTSDVMALALAAFASRLAQRPAHKTMTYGYGRSRVLAAQVNGVALWFLSGWIAWEAVERIMNPPQVSGAIVMVIALAGLMVNLIILRWLHGEGDINSRAAYWHVAGDALGSVAAMIAGVVIWLTGWMPIDPLLSMLVAAILAWGGWRLIRETTAELMDAVPSHVDLHKIERAMQSIAGVEGVHHTHIWSIQGECVALSAHIEIDAMAEWDEILPVLLTLLHEKSISHATLQPESAQLQSSCACKGRHC
ncbi:MAG: cation diffusion facilitator family transporter [Mariprofundus sp.]